MRYLPLCLLLACHPPTLIVGHTTPITPISTTPQDSAPKAQLRLVPPEAYLRTYLALFGAPSPSDAQKLARGGDNGQLFDNWNDYLSALGFPDHRNDLPRANQTNALMVASFERLGIALCDRAVERDLHNKPPQDAQQLFKFPSADATTIAVFTEHFDVIHRAFLGYPVALGPPERAANFYALYRQILAHHSKDPVRSRFTPAEAAWANVCYGLSRHPEFHLY